MTKGNLSCLGVIWFLVGWEKAICFGGAFGSKLDEKSPFVGRGLCFWLDEKSPFVGRGLCFWLDEKRSSVLGPFGSLLDEKSPFVWEDYVFGWMRKGHLYWGLDGASERAYTHTHTHSLSLFLSPQLISQAFCTIAAVCARGKPCPLPPGHTEFPRQRARPSSLFVVHNTLGPSSQDCGTMLLRSGSGSQSSACKEVRIVTQTTSLAR